MATQFNLRFYLIVYDGMGNQTLNQKFEIPAKCAAEWMLRVSQGQLAHIRTEGNPAPQGGAT